MYCQWLNKWAIALISGGHPLTAAIQNDLAEILLGPFIPWQKLHSLFNNAPTTAGSSSDSLHSIWSSGEPTLPSYIRTFAQNIELLRKSKDDCEADMALRNLSNHHTSPLDQEFTSRFILNRILRTSQLRTCKLMTLSAKKRSWLPF